MNSRNFRVWVTTIVAMLALGTLSSAQDRTAPEPPTNLTADLSSLPSTPIANIDRYKQLQKLALTRINKIHYFDFIGECQGIVAACVPVVLPNRPCPPLCPQPKAIEDTLKCGQNLASGKARFVVRQVSVGHDDVICEPNVPPEKVAELIQALSKLTETLGRSTAEVSRDRIVFTSTPLSTTVDFGKQGVEGLKFSNQAYKDMRDPNIVNLPTGVPRP